MLLMFCNPAIKVLMIVMTGLGSTTSSKGTVNIDKVVQQVLLPASVSLQPGATTLTSTLAPLSTTTTTLPSSTSVQPYIHPSLVSGKEVQATLGKTIACIFLIVITVQPWVTLIQEMETVPPGDVMM